MNKTYMSVVVAIIFCLGAALYINVVVMSSNTTTTNIDELSQQDKKTQSLKDPQADTDNDGLKNWEEDLYGTSKKSPDSDGDGVGDGDEVAQGTDPTLYGAVAYQAEEVVIAEQVHDQGFNPIEPDFDINSIQNALSGDPDALLNLFGSEFSEALGIESGVDINVKPQATSMKNDINRIGTIVENASVTTIADSESINQYFAGTNANREALSRAVAADNKAAVELGNLRSLTPKIQEFITTLTIQYMELARVTAILRGKGATGTEEEHPEWEVYTNLVAAWLGTMGDIHTYVKAEQLTFNESEPGHIFMFEVAQ